VRVAPAPVGFQPLDFVAGIGAAPLVSAARLLRLDDRPAAGEASGCYGLVGHRIAPMKIKREK